MGAVQSLHPSLSLHTLYPSLLAPSQPSCCHSLAAQQPPLRKRKDRSGQPASTCLVWLAYLAARLTLTATLLSRLGRATTPLRCRSRNYAARSVKDTGVVYRQNHVWLTGMGCIAWWWQR